MNQCKPLADGTTVDGCCGGGGVGDSATATTSLAGDANADETDESLAVWDSIARDSATSVDEIWITSTEAPAERARDSASSHPRASTTSPAVLPFKVLLAEDSRANQLAISRLLRAQAGAYTRPLFSSISAVSDT